jgi:hypothetical protein
MNKFQYNTDGDDYKFSIESNWSDEDPEWLAEDCAEDFYKNRDGWESHWPITFYLYNLGEDDHFAVVEVGMEFEPTFSGSKL